MHIALLGCLEKSTKSGYMTTRGAYCNKFEFKFPLL